MLVFVDIRVNTKDWTEQELWNAWEDEVNAAAGANEAGKIKSIYKVSGQRRVLVTLDVDSHDELDAILMAGLPMAHNLEIDEILPVRSYWDFADDVRNRWGAASE